MLEALDVARNSRLWRSAPRGSSRSSPSVVARFSGHRTAAVFKRYNIATRKEAEEVQAAQAAPGPDSVAVDDG